MRTLHLLASADRRGAEVFAVRLAERLEALGHEADVVALQAPTNPGGGLDVDVVAGFPRPAAVRALRRRAASCDVVLGHGSRGLVAGTAATVGTKVPLVYRSIGDPTFWGSSRLRRARVGLQLRRATLVTALWPAAAEAIADQYGVDPTRITVVPNAGDERTFSPATAEARRTARHALELGAEVPVVAYVGALAPEKRVPQVVAAVAQVPGAVLVVAGDGPERAAVDAALARWLPDRHRALGSVSDVASVLAAADALILLSATEGQPGTAIEAGLSGLPVLSTDVGGVSSVVLDGQTGALVPADAGPDEVGEALAALLADGPRLGAAAATRCRASFALDVVAGQFDVALRRAVAAT